MYVTSYDFDDNEPQLNIEFPEVEDRGMVGSIELPPNVLTEIITMGQGGDNEALIHLVGVVDPLTWLATDEGEDIEVNGYNLKALVRKGCEEFKDDLKEYQPL